ncbi:MAG: hypothetical protein ABI868_01880 [Acidobacteriota bacterium]
MRSNYFRVIATAWLALVPGLASADGANVLFYNATTRAGAVGKLTVSEFQTTKTFPAGAFGVWTQIACVDSSHSLLFYNADTGAGADGVLDHGDFRTTSTSQGFALGWTHILDAHLYSFTGSVRRPLPLFYNLATGSGAVGYSPTVRVYPDRAFAVNWTQIATTQSGTLFYNARTGQGAVTVPIESGARGGSPTKADDVRTTAVYGPGAFSTGWTHVVAAASDILFYNAVDGSAAIGRIVGGSFQTTKVYDPGSFGRGWTHVVAAKTAQTFLFYNAGTGEGAVGEIANGRFRTTKVYPADAFAKGWTHLVVAAADSVPSGPVH